MRRVSRAAGFIETAGSRLHWIDEGDRWTAYAKDTELRIARVASGYEWEIEGGETGTSDELLSAQLAVVDALAAKIVPSSLTDGTEGRTVASKLDDLMHAAYARLAEGEPRTADFADFIKKKDDERGSEPEGGSVELDHDEDVPEEPKADKPEDGPPERKPEGEDIPDVSDLSKPELKDLLIDVAEELVPDPKSKKDKPEGDPKDVPTGSDVLIVPASRTVTAEFTWEADTAGGAELRGLPEGLGAVWVQPAPLGAGGTWWWGIGDGSESQSHEALSEEDAKAQAEDAARDLASSSFTVGDGFQASAEDDAAPLG